MSNSDIPAIFSQTVTTVGSIGEIALIQQIQEVIGRNSPPPPEGIGDDCAVWTPPENEKILLTVDPLIFGKHFSDNDAPELVGGKLLKRNLSDIAAMGGDPGPALLSLAMGPDVCLDWLMRLITGLAETCEKFRVPLSGGDVAAAEPQTFVATLTQTGTAISPISRMGAELNSPIYVTGTLGGSIHGKHLRFVPRLEEGKWLASQENVLSMTDVSDGLAKDLPALLKRGRQANLDLAEIPVDPFSDGIEGAFCDGEDYELLFTLEPGTQVKDWPFAIPCHKIGHVRKSRGQGTLIDIATGKPLEFFGRGYEHFQS